MNREQHNAFRIGTCVHFRGVQYDECAAGVRLDDVKDSETGRAHRWPCLPTLSGKPCATTCSKKQVPTVEEVEAEERHVDELLARLASGERVPGVFVTPTYDARNPIGSLAHLDMVIAAGLGSAVVTRDGKVVFDGEARADDDRFLTLREVERHVVRQQHAWAQRRDRGPAPVWRVAIDAPLWSATWERQRPGKWVCIEHGEGFA